MEITGWPVDIEGTIYYTPVTLKLAPGTYTVSESLSGTWMSTTPKSVEVVLVCDDEETVSFGNLCLGAGGGMTPGYWSNKNGEKTFTTVIGTGDALSALVDLNLWKYNKKTGVATEFNPTSYKQVKDWLLARDAVDMRYQLSASLAAMQLNVLADFVDGNAIVYAGPALGFVSIDDLMTAADTALWDSTSTRDTLEQFHDALDDLHVVDIERADGVAAYFFGTVDGGIDALAQRFGEVESHIFQLAFARGKVIFNAENRQYKTQERGCRVYDCAEN